MIWIVTGRKHVQLYEVEAQIRTDDVAKLRDAVAKRREATMAFSAADGDDEETTADLAEFFVSYGPVRGANRTDVTRFLDHHNIGYVLDNTTAATSRTCGCATSSLPCTDGAAPIPGEAVASPSSTSAAPEWRSGMDW